MNRITLIAIVSGIVLLILLTWGYLFIFGTPKAAEDIFARFGIVGTGTETFEDNTLVDTSPTAADGSPQPLRQLTTRPVAGMNFTGTDTVQYVERGTGHVFEIALTSGAETQISNATYPKVIDAEVSSNGDSVAFTTETETGTRTGLGTVTEDGEGADTVLDAITLPIGAHNTQFSADGTELFYLLDTGEATEGHVYTLADQSDRITFTAPFTAAELSNGEANYLYTTPTATLPGYMYDVRKNTLAYAREGGFGLTVFGYAGGFVATEEIGGNAFTRAYERDDTVYQLPLTLFPEKCAVVANATSIFVCAAPLTSGDTGDYPDDWYKGVTSFNDALWHVDIRQEEAVLLSDPESQTGRVIDVAKIVGNAEGTRFLLINKNDNTLWLFEPAS